jgi:transposase
MKHTEQFKLSVVQRYLDGPDGFTKLGRELGLSTTALRNWVSRYQQHGIAGLSRRTWRRHSDDFKLKVLQHMWENGLSYRETAVVFNLPNSNRVAEWDRHHKSGISVQMQRLRIPSPMKKPTIPSVHLDDKERSQKDLIEELKYLRAENAVLKKLNALAESKKAALKKEQK